jgi:hypothetical protein
MRLSLPMPRRTASTSAPTKSAKLAISFMNEMRVASMALAAYMQVGLLVLLVHFQFKMQAVIGD